MWWRKKQRSDVSTSEDELDSECDDDDMDEEGPTLVTVDDGRGGVKHIKVTPLTVSSLLSCLLLVNLYGLGSLGDDIRC